MTRQELAQRIAAEGFRSDAVSLDGVTPAYDGLVLKHSGNRWYVDYFERGETDRLGTFRTEEEACEFLYSLLLKDSTARQ